MNDSLQQAIEWFNKAQTARAFKKYRDAIKYLEDAVPIFLAHEKTPDSDTNLQSIQRYLYDSYGQLGGLYRRLSDLGMAAKMYSKGKGYEQNFDDSYNLTNSIVIPILIDGHALKGQEREIQEALKIVEAQVNGTRSESIWALADFAELLLLNNNLDKALNIYEKLLKKKPSRADLGSVLSVLGELYHALAKAQSSVAPQFCRAIRYLDPKLQVIKSLPDNQNFDCN